MSKCPNCGAEIEFDAGAQQVHCSYCGSDFDPKELEASVNAAKAVETFEGKTYTCTQCGASLMTFDETAITFCSYCGSQSMLEEKMVKQNNPDFIIPFKVTQEQCEENYRKKVKSSLYVPNYMKEDLVVKKFRGIYMPYGIYKLSFHGPSYNKGSVQSHRSGDYIIYNDYKITTQVDADYDGVSFDLLSNFYDEYSLSIPFNYREAEPFNLNYMHGFYADSKDVDINNYNSDAEAIATEDSTRFMRKNRTFARYGCSNPVALMTVTERSVGMFPVYFLSVRDKSGEHVHYVVVNGQTGKVSADLPIDFMKYVVGSLILAIPIFLVLNLIPIILPLWVNVLSVIMSIFSIIICLLQTSKVNDRTNFTGDKGMNGETGKIKGKKAKKENGAKYIWKQVFAMVIALVPVFVKPVEDFYYYGASILSFLLIIWGFYDLIKIHNLMVCRELPQLKKRGGDESE